MASASASASAWMLQQQHHVSACGRRGPLCCSRVSVPASHTLVRVRSYCYSSSFCTALQLKQQHRTLQLGDLSGRYVAVCLAASAAAIISSSSSSRAAASRIRVRCSSIAENGNGNGSDDGHGRGGGGGGGGDGEGEDEDKEKNLEEALVVLKALGDPQLPADLDQAVRRGLIPASVLQRYFDLEKSLVFRWLMRFTGFKERLLADDLFFAKVAMECGVGIFTKTAAELERRRDKFMKEIDFVIADVVMAIIADFMLVWLPAPTVPLHSALGARAGFLTKLFHGCPDNAFQVALRGTSYSFLQRLGAIVRNGGKLFLVGTSASLIGTAATNLLIGIRKNMYEVYTGESEEVPILSTSLAYGAYMAISSNLRYQILAGVVEQRILEPMLHKQKLLLSILCFAARTGNTFLGSQMWVDYARWVGVQ